MEKGAQWFRNTVSRLVGKDCQNNWCHIGIVCFPNIENRDFFRTNQIELDEEMLKVSYRFIVSDFHYLFYCQFLECLDKERVRGW